MVDKLVAGSTRGTNGKRPCTVALISAFAVVPLTKVAFIGASVGIVAFGFAFFGTITYAGQKIMEAMEEEKEQLPQTQVNGEVK